VSIFQFLAACPYGCPADFSLKIEEKGRKRVKGEEEEEGEEEKEGEGEEEGNLAPRAWTRNQG